MNIKIEQFRIYWLQVFVVGIFFFVVMFFLWFSSIIMWWFIVWLTNQILYLFEYKSIAMRQKNWWFTYDDRSNYLIFCGLKLGDSSIFDWFYSFLNTFSSNDLEDSRRSFKMCSTLLSGRRTPTIFDWSSIFNRITRIWLLITNCSMRLQYAKIDPDNTVYRRRLIPY